ncbi:MAG: CinA family protein [Bacteroidales bacterium]|nr:CinA family protein [Bacteroidales bacterium]
MRVEEKIASLLKGSGMTLSAAESCTGGRISHLITTVSGSSEYYLGSVTSYAVSVKEKVLGVPSSTVSTCGVVSAEVAAAMAQGVQSLTGSTFSVATTGLAEGGNDRYPEGTVWIAAAFPGGVRTLLYQYNHGRKDNIRRFAIVSLRFLAKTIEDYVNNCEIGNKTKL